MSESLTPDGTGITNASDLIRTLAHKAPKAALGLAVGQAVWPVAKGLHAKHKAQRTYSIKVTEDDEMYDELHEWVLGLLPEHQQRSLVAWTSRTPRSGRGMTSLDSLDGRAPTPRLRLRYDGSREQTITVSGHRVKVVVVSGEGYDKDGAFKPAEITFWMHSLEAQRELLRQIEAEIVRKQQVVRQPRFRMLAKWGDWQSLDELPHRDLDSVILPEGQLQRLIADVARFLDTESDYLRRCVPWHRGHLYEGPPGTGKTSVARAIASHFGMDIWYLPLADLDKDSGLLSVISRITARSMLLLEDVDVFHAATMRDDDNGVTLSGLLNALDGIATPHGLFTVLTTNTPDVLDPAIIRPGRVDLIEHFAHADADQVGRLLTRWYDQPIEADDLEGISPAEIIEICKRHDDPERAVKELRVSQEAR